MAPLHQTQFETMNDTINDKQSTEDGGAVGKPAVMQWVACSDALPPASGDGKYGNPYGCSDKVLCFSRSWGIKLGGYYHGKGYWYVDGVSLSERPVVEWWAFVRPPVA